jgi:RNA-directed DNA polymerase
VDSDVQGSEVLRDWIAAYRWLCQRRMRAPPNADVWHLRYHWPVLNDRLYRRVLAGQYRLSPMQVVGWRDPIAQWCAADALVLKWVALRVAAFLPRHARCLHLKGTGGVHTAVSQVADACVSGDYAYVLRTDIKGYYRHIRKRQVIHQVRRAGLDPVLQDLTEQYVHYSVEKGGEIVTPELGICRGCALSPLLGASLLHHVDAHFAGQESLFYVRYMDDFLLLTRTRWHLRKAIRELNTFFDWSGFEKHPEKTQMGRIERGFDWLGVWLQPGRAAAIAPRAHTNHRERRARLYERVRASGLPEAAVQARMRAYDERWTLWAERLLQWCNEPDA